MDYGELIKLKREAKGVTRKQLTNIMGLRDVSNLYLWEKGKQLTTLKSFIRAMNAMEYDVLFVAEDGTEYTDFKEYMVAEREKRKIRKSDLSLRIGKASTYISQIETSMYMPSQYVADDIMYELHGHMEIRDRELMV